VTSKYRRLPVRAYFDGFTMLPNGTNEKFSEIHDFYHFKPEEVNEEAFQTPPDIVCMDRKPTLKTPKPSSHFRFSHEDVTNGAVSYVRDLIYDSDRKLVRLEMRPPRGQLMEQYFYVTDPLIVTNDYNLGVSFNYNKNLKNCSIISIPDTSFDEDYNYTLSLFNSSNSFEVRLKSAESILGLDSEYIFNGQRMINDLPVDTFVSDRSGLTGTPTTAEYAFVSQGYGFETTSGVQSNVPFIFIQRDPAVLLNFIS